MSHRNVRTAVLLAAAAIAASVSPAAMTAETAPADELSEVVVYGIVYRNRTTDTAPVLSYDLEYFQRFEPATVGDMLKRVTSADSSPTSWRRRRPAARLDPGHAGASTARKCPAPAMTAASGSIAFRRT